MIKLSSVSGAIHAIRHGDQWFFVVDGCACGRSHDRVSEAESCASETRKRPLKQAIASQQN